MPIRKKILIGFFLLLITSGLYGLVISPHITIKEKRQPAALPEYKAERLIKSRYYTKLGDFLNDRYPYRPPLIIAKNWVDYYIFSTSPSPKVHIGKDGWFYLNIGLRDYFKDDCEKQERAQALARELQAFERILESNGKRFFFIVAPDKATIYPEHVGFERPPNACGKNFYDLFIEALDKYPVHGFIRLDKVLLNARKNFLLYFQKDTHWNYRGATIASKIILKRLSDADKKYSLPEIEFVKVNQVRDLAKNFALGLAENLEFPIKIHQRGTVDIKKLSPLLNKKPRLKITTTAKPGSALAPRIIIYRDSFMSMPQVLMSDNFKYLDSFWTRRIPVGPKWDFSNIRDSKIFIIEVVERRLPDLNLREKALLRALRSSAVHKRGKQKL